MISPHRFDHRATVNRPSESKDDLRRTVVVYAPQPSAIPLMLAAAAPTLQDPGIGESPAGARTAVAPANVDVQPRDVLGITAGPEAPVNMRVLGVTKPRGHHTEMTLEPFHGALTTVLLGHLVADGAGYTLSTTGPSTAVFVADGVGYGLATAASNPTIAARLLGFGTSFILRPL